jgi:CubicO group peptidase (beta-lactamase class C family)
LTQALLDHLTCAVTDGIFPSAHAIVFDGDAILFDEIVGTALKRTQFFDIASLTKPIATATICMASVQEGLLDLDRDVSQLLGILSGITTRDLLTHTSGLPAWEPLFQAHPHLPPRPDEAKKDFLARIGAMPARAESPTCYSDLGFIVLGALLETIHGLPLEKIFTHKVALPLGLDDTFYNPILSKKVTDENLFVPTEDCTWRKRLLAGEVMDDNAWALGGVAGHAGLFSKAGDVFRWIRHLKAALDGKDGFLQQTTVAPFLSVPPVPSRPAFTLGFDTPSVPSSAGTCFSENTIGHLAYTGCSFWWDVDRDRGVILLTNRVHPSRANDKIKAFRPAFHDLAWQIVFPK